MHGNPKRCDMGAFEANCGHISQFSFNCHLFNFIALSRHVSNSRDTYTHIFMCVRVDKRIL